MTQARFESIADARRAHALSLLAAERERAARSLAMNVIGNSGTPRPATATAEINRVIDDLDARAARLASLEGDDLVIEFAADCL